VPNPCRNLTQLQELRQHFNSKPGVRLGDHYRSATGHKDLVVRVAGGLQECLRLDGTVYANTKSKYTIRVKVVTEHLVRAFQVVSDNLSSSLAFQNISGRTSQEVLHSAQDLARRKNVVEPIEAEVLEPKAPKPEIRVYVTGVNSATSKSDLESQLRALLLEQNLEGFLSATRSCGDAARGGYRFLFFDTLDHAQAFVARHRAAAAAARPPEGLPNPFLLGSQAFTCKEPQVHLPPVGDGFLPKGVLYFDKVSSATSYKKAIDAEPFTFEGEVILCLFPFSLQNNF
jgi:hypothetical protein